MRRTGIIVAAGLLAGVVGLTGCGATQAPVRDQASAAATSAERQALVALGFDPADVTAAAGATPSGGPDRGRKGDGGRKGNRTGALLRKNTLHGEIVVQTKQGAKTVAVQRGTVTAIDGDSMTVKSTDGFSMTWRFADKLRVVERRSAVQPDQIEIGDRVGVAGTKDGDHGVARLIVVPRAK